MCDRVCANCVYAVRAVGRWHRVMQSRWPGLRTCINHPEAPGELHETVATGTCRNFRARPKPVVRGEPPEPPDDSIRYIPLTRGKFAIVDAADYEWLSKYKWLATGNEKRGFYAGRRVGQGMLLMHRAIMQPPPGMVVDHISGNGLDQRRANLRVCSQRHNSHNRRPSRWTSSRFKGVYFCRATGKWVATIGFEGRSIHLGSFDDEVEAARVYDRKARELFGEYAYLNFPADAETMQERGSDVAVRSDGRAGENAGPA
ncbi:MAG: HNH endonuclease [Sedimentisphaerales bacterium]|nr:HNH endonuclease [Sedimentisphaerales bacterium]NLT76579.1 hypothetical protein [Planctomycetota bacterium]